MPAISPYQPMSEDIIAVVDDEACNPDRCDHECIRFDPLNRSPSGPEGFRIDEESGKARIPESVVMEGHRISADKCPFDAIKLVNLEHETGEVLHQYGENQFRLYGLPAPEEGEVVGLLGRNGIGKSTALEILAGKIEPNLGAYREGAEWDEIVTAHRGTALQTHFEALSEGDVEASLKVQRVDAIGERYGELAVEELLGELDERGIVEELAEDLEMEAMLSNSVGDLSGGEMQRVAVAGCLARDADLYLVDEPSSFLDVKQRLNVARAIREHTGERKCVVVEHDLATLDLLADLVHVVHGEPGAYGMVSNAMTSRVGINQYLRGYLDSHNLRIRSEAIEFARGSGESVSGHEALTYPDMAKSFGEDAFSLEVEGGTLHEGEVVGVLGQNALGKTTFAKLLAGELEPDSSGGSDEDTAELDATISYKPQHLAPPTGTVEVAFAQAEVDLSSQTFQTRVAQPLELEELYERRAADLSGGELQRVGVGICLGRDADLYLLDEPSAYLDVETRIRLARNLRRFGRATETPVVVIDHDLVFLDYIADTAMVFDGEPGVAGVGHAPQEVRDGFNAFLQGADVTFRTDPDSGRPRANKPGSQKDREQRNKGEYYEG